MKNLIFFVGGMVVGAGIGVLAVRGHYRKLAFDEINEIREYSKRKIAAKELAEKNKEAKNEMLNDISDEKNAPKSEESGKSGTYQEVIDRYSGKFNVFSNPPDAEKIDNSYEEDDESEGETEDPYEIFVAHESPGEENPEPYLITEEQFASEKLFYDKVMLEYYDDGYAVLEDSDDIVESIEDLIGPYILGKPIEDDTIYVRNNSRSTDYGIIFTGKSLVPEEGSD